MKVLIIVANPNIGKSFCHRLAKEAANVFKKNEDEVRFTDLYEIDFRAVGGMKDFTKVQNVEYFDYQMEQKHAVLNENFETFCPEVRKQIDLLKWSDFVLFVFPFYWFNVPAIVKGWLDRILVYFWAYGHGGSCTLSPRKISYCLTSGGPSVERGGAYDPSKIRDLFLYGFEYALKRVGLEVLEPFFCFGSTLYKIEKSEEGEEGGKSVITKPGKKERDDWVDGFIGHIEKKYF